MRTFLILMLAAACFVAGFGTNFAKRYFSGVEVVIDNRSEKALTGVSIEFAGVNTLVGGIAPGRQHKITLPGRTKGKLRVEWKGVPAGEDARKLDFDIGDNERGRILIYVDRQGRTQTSTDIIRRS